MASEVKEFLEAVQVVQTALFLGLALVVGLQWLKHRDQASAWAAATFGVLGAVAVAGRFLPEESTELVLARELLIAVLLLFPYLLYRFARVFRAAPRWIDVTAALLTAAVCTVIFFFDEVPGEGDPRPTSFLLYSLAILVQWAFLSALVSVWLWKAGSGRPTVIRRRMRTLSLGAASLFAAILISVAAGPSPEEPGGAEALSALVAFISGPLFLLGAAPPSIVLALWRRPEELALYEAEAALMAATSTDEVAQGLLPHVARTIGARGATLTAHNGTELAAYGDMSPAGDTASAPVLMELRSATLSVATDSFTPFFGREEVGLLTRLSSLTDVALRRAELADRERATAAELETANVSMREFVAIASHDLRTPVAAIKGYAELLTDGSDVANKEFAATIIRQADHLSRIVDDLLTVSRIDSGALEPQRAQLALREVVYEVVADLGVSDSTAVEGVDGLVVLADPDHLRRMLRNLLENAQNYGEPPVEIVACSSDGAVEIRVCDRGAGIAPDFESRLFERFARSSKAISRSKHGTGLGLSIVRGLARAGGGDAWYERRPEGACFGVRLPVSGGDRE
ncbi:MAG TPA: ATP-binding protein [Acidimicrobiales bacterium]|nr:ATP-binding protein [Acidimicrobiales bacterium]